MEKAGFSWKFGRAVPVWGLGRKRTQKNLSFSALSAAPARHCYYNSDNDNNNNNDINM